MAMMGPIEKRKGKETGVRMWSNLTVSRQTAQSISSLKPLILLQTGFSDH